MVRASITFFTLMVFVGCGGGAPPAAKLPKTEPVSGIVTLDEKPIAGAVVTFVPAGDTKGVECVGRTDESGKYTPTQMRGTEGVPVGVYKVVISRFLRGGQPITTEDGGGGSGGVVTESLPPKYSNPAQTKLNATIKEGGGTVDFKLTSK